MFFKFSLILPCRGAEAQSREYDVGRQARGRREDGRREDGRREDGRREDGRTVDGRTGDGGLLVCRTELCRTCPRPDQQTETGAKAF